MDEGIQIRRVQRQDLPQIRQLYQELVSEDISIRAYEENYEIVSHHPDSLLLAAVRGGLVVGSAMGVVCMALDAPFLVIENVVVDCGCRGQGIGRTMFEALDRFAAEHSCQYALLVSSAFRKEAHAFYEGMGYTDDVRGFRKYYEI